MARIKNYELVLTIDFYGTVLAPLVFPLFLGIVAVQEKSFGIFVDFLWVFPVIPLYYLVALLPLQAIIRNATIDHKNKSVTLRESLYHVYVVPEGALRRVTLVKDALGFPSVIMYCLLNGEMKEYEWTFWIYTKKGRRKIMDALIEFNPWVDRPDGFD